MLVAAVALLSGTMVVYAATTLFTQTFPGQTFTTLTLVEGSSCSGGNLEIDTAGSTIPTDSGSFSRIMYDCSTSQQAFSTQGSANATITVTPTFTVPAGWALAVTGAVYPFNAASQPCSSNPSTVYPALTSGTPVTLNGGTNYVYCLTSSSASTFTSFSITWSQ